MKYYIFRSGSWFSYHESCDISNRYGAGLKIRDNITGFRLTKKLKKWIIILFAAADGTALLGFATHCIATTSIQITANAL